MDSEIQRGLDRRLAAAAAVEREAGRPARRYFERRADLSVEVKRPQGLVSVADRAVEELIRTRLGALFPDDAVVGEEAGGLAAALQPAHVACGRLDATWDPYLLPWDVLAGILLVEEAGGAAAPYRLRPDFSGGAPLLAGAAALADALRPFVTDRTD